MIFELALIAAALNPSDISGEFSGYKRLDGALTRYERFDLDLTNRASEARELRVCPNDADMVLLTHQRSTRSAFAMSIDNKDWNFNCQSRTLAPGETITLKMFFRPTFEFGPAREILLETNLGDFTLTD